MATGTKKKLKAGDLTVEKIVRAASKEGFDVKVSLREKSFPPFFMVYVQGGESPKHVHGDAMSACKEAERLAKLTDKNVFVLTALSRCEASEKPINWTLVGNEPFVKPPDPAQPTGVTIQKNF